MGNASSQVDFGRDVEPGTGKPADKTSRVDNPAVKDAARSERSLEQAVEDSFPASDPPAPAQPAKTAAPDKGETADPHLDEELDESLDDSFPASDPPAMTQPAGEHMGRPHRDPPAPGETRVADFLKPKG